MKKRNIAKETFQQQERAYRKKLDFNNIKFIHAFINLKSHVVTHGYSNPYQGLYFEDVEVLRKAANRKLLFEHGVKTHFLHHYRSECAEPIIPRPAYGESHYKQENDNDLPF